MGGAPHDRRASETDGAGVSLDSGEGRRVTRARDTGDAQRALTEASAHWSATFDAINDLVCLLDREGTVLRCNRSMIELLGLESDEVAGRKCYDLMQYGRSFFERCPYVEMLRTGRRETFELPRGGRWYQVTADPLRLDGEIVGAVHIVRDVTDRRLTDEASPSSLADSSPSTPSRSTWPHSRATPTWDRSWRAGCESSLVAPPYRSSEYNPQDKVLMTTSVEFQKGAVKTLTSPLVRRLRKTYVHKLFAPLQRLHAADEFPGAGIGLATVAHVLERLGGTCRAEGEVGHGARFFFTLGAAAARVDW